MEKKEIMIKRSVLGSMAALAVMAVVGCAEEMTQLLSSRQEVEVNTAFSPLDGQSLTRAENGLDISSTGFSVLTGSGSGQSTSSTVKIKVDDGSSNYTAYTYNITGSSAIAAASTAPTFPAEVNSVNVYGWYPGTASSSTTFSIQTNQQSNVNYCLSDLMLANKATCTRDASSVTPANLTFRHVMSKVKLTVTPGSGVTVTDIALKNVKPTVTINESNPASLDVGEASGSAGDVTLLSSGTQTAAATYAAVFPGQSISGNFITITATIDGTPSTITYSFGGGSKTFVKNKEYTININVSATQTDSPTVSLEDWTGTEGTVNIGGGGGGGGGVTLDNTSLNLTQGGTHGTTTATEDGTYTAYSGNTGIVTVSVSGKTVSIDPVGVGTTNVIVFNNTGGVTNSAFCEVTVRAANGIDYSEINSAHIGYVVATNGKCYANVTAATEDGVTEILGMLIYVGSHTGKTTSGGNTNTSQTVSCTNGVIAALQDAGTDSDRMYNNTLPTNNNAWTARDYTSTAITSLGSWVSATDNDWKDFMVACSNAYIAQGLSGATVTADSNTPVAFWALMERCGGTGATAVVAGGQHWTNCGVSSPSRGTTYSWPYFSDSGWAVASDYYTGDYGTSGSWYSSSGAQGYAVRAVRAF